MAGNNYGVFTLPIGAFAGSTAHPIIHLPASVGAITVTGVYLAGGGDGTAIGLGLYKYTNVATGGTPALSGTIATFAGTIIPDAAAVYLGTIVTAKVDPGTVGCWLGVDQTSGTVAATTVITVNYKEGI